MTSSKKSPVRVAVVGSGIAGLTAALRLSQRGYQVTVYEEKDVVGGNLSTERVKVKGPDGKESWIDHDVYPHMFPQWYTNFWQLFEEDLGLKRDAHFAPRYGVKLLTKGSRDYVDTRSPNSLQDIMANLRSGMLPLPDLFLWGYSMLDLASQPFHKEQFLSRYSVNGFLNSRTYSTELTAMLHDLVLMEIWSLHGDQTSAADYKDFVKHTFSFPESVPFAWMLKGSLWEKLIKPWREKLEEHGCKIKHGYRVDTVRLMDDVVELSVIDVNDRDTDDEPKPTQILADYVVLAVPPSALGKLVTRRPKDHNGAVSRIRGERIVDRVPLLSEVRRLNAEPVAVLDLYFKLELPDIPEDHVGLSWSGYNLTFIDISKLWTDDPNMQGVTVLVLAASDSYALPSEDDSEENGYLMIQRLHEYLPIFNPGRHWGDENSDICWEKSRFRSNDENKLFINQVGVGQWRPQTSYAALPHVVFAGDTVPTDVSMATIEAAVLSGIQAAQAIRERKPLGDPIEITELPGHSDTAFLAIKLALTPSAYVAKWWATAIGAMPHLAKGELRKGLIRPTVSNLSLPYAYVGEWAQTAYRFWGSVVDDAKKARERRRNER